MTRTLPIDIPHVVVEDADDSSGSRSESDPTESPSLTPSDTETAIYAKEDSGVDCSEVPFDLPDDDQVTKVVQQVEHYLSDAVLLKDPFLLKHVRRHKDGFVNVKLIASFRKVRTLAKNWRTVAYCLRKSSTLELNDEGTRVRRKKPLPAYDETVPSRTVVAYNLPLDKPTVENVSELFAKCGEIALVRILRPGGTAPPDVKCFLQKIPKLGAKVSALVEFEDHEGACKALQMDGGDEDWRALHVKPLVVKDIQIQKVKQGPASEVASSTKKKKRGKKPAHGRQHKDVGSSASETEQAPRSRSSTGSDYLSSSPSQHSSPDPRRWRKSTFDNPTIAASFSDKKQPQNISDISTTPPGGSPWRRRREMSSVNRTSPVSNVRLPDGVIRLPRGPDDTKGFCWNRVPHAVSVR